MSQSVEKKIEELRKKIEEYRYNYYSLNKPTISDFEFDSLMLELERLEAENPHLITSDSPSQKVGTDILVSSKLVKHKIPMLSIQNEKDLLKFDSTVKKLLNVDHTIEYITELKIDGASVSINYVGGKLKTAATRGDGIFGEDITENVKTIKSVPSFLKNRDNLNYNFDDIEVRGEIFLYRADFEKLNVERRKNGEEPFANPRNLAAGLIKTKNSKEVAKKPLNIFAYTLISLNESFKSQKENLDILKKLGFTVNNRFRKCFGINEVIDFCSEIEKEREELPYNIDGVVVKVNSIAQQKLLGYRNDSPYWACAYKFIPPQATTEVLGITWQVGRTGAVTPVAELKTIELDGSNISRATLHNYDEIKKKDIRIGDKVVIEKGGDVIPKVVEVLIKDPNRRSTPTIPPERCPACNSKLKKQKNEVAYYCKNSSCPGQLINQITHFVSKDALDIKDIGNKIAIKLIENNVINSPLDLFKLKLNDLSNLNLGTKSNVRLLGEKKAEKILEEIKEAKSKTLSKWLFAIGIPKLGKIGAQAIAKNHDSFESIINSQILKDILQFHSLIEKAELTNPRAKKNKDKTESEKHNLGKEFSSLVDEIDEIGKRLVQSGWYQNKNKISKNSLVKLIPAYTLISNKGVGNESAKAVKDFFQSNTGINFINSIKELNISPGKIKTLGGILDGVLIILTGTLTNYTREQITEIIEKNGGRASTSFSKQANFILAGDKAGSKLDKAKEAGIKIISESELMDMINEPNKNFELISKKNKPEQLDMF